MKKASIIISSLLFSFLLIIPMQSFAHEGEHKESGDHGKGMEHQKMEEGSGSSAMESSSHEKEYAEEGEEEGSFSYRRHREEMKHKSMKGEMEAPAGAAPAGKMEEGSGKR